MSSPPPPRVVAEGVAAAADDRMAGHVERLVANPLARSAYASLVAHVLGGIALALLALPTIHRDPPRPLQLSLVDGDDPVPGESDEAEATIGGLDAGTASDEVAAVAPPEAPGTEAEGPAGVTAPEETVSPAEGPALEPVAAGPTVAGPATTAAGPAPAAAPAPGGAAGATTESYAARRGAERGLAARGRGGNAASEAAVERGLAWLALHQAGDGSWRFDLAGCRCDGACRDPGTLPSTTASTAIALLPFLGAGNTHVDGRYQETVSRGLYYLVSRQQPTARGGDLSEGTMYGHGIATLAIAEALGMTGDDMLRKPCRDAVRFIETAQDLHGGGWRYLPGQSGDITVTAWQLAALRSAGVAGVETSSPTFENARRFLDAVQARNGSAYGYRTPAAAPCTSAIGLLCRMYTGWSSDEEPLRRGITALAKPGPKPHAIYHNFYLAQALVQTDHPVWPRWNARNRDQIVALQTRVGHEAGSWFFADRETAPGGRLAHTALAVLTLEVYYRLLPIYREEAVAGTP